MILITVWDGLRPDLVTPELTPFLAEMARQGAQCPASRAAWPSATRINSATLSTGCWPGRHGLVDNELYVPGLDPVRPIDCANALALQAMADLEGGRLLTVPTLSEMLADAGLRMISGGSGSPGTTYLTNPTLTGPIVNWAMAWPTTIADEMVARYGAFLSTESESPQRHARVIHALRDWLIPAYEPDVVTIWLTEPDHAQHEHGLLSPQARSALRHVDDEVRALAAHLARTQSQFTSLVLSDHGFDTIGPRVDVAGELIAAGFKAGPASTDIVRASNSLYLDASTQARLPELCAFLLTRPWLGALLARDDLLAQCPGALPQSAVMGGHARSAELMFGFQWSDAANAYGVPGTIWGGGRSAATHGAASPYSMNNVLIAWGAGIRSSTLSPLPAGMADIAPIVLRLLDVAPPAGLDGRVLDEILAGSAASALSATTETRVASAQTPFGERHQEARYQRVGGKLYLDRITMTPLPGGEGGA